jgi:hypothetical protein
MLSQPATKIFLRTSEPHAAKWISDTIGEVEMERVKETVNTHPLKITKSRSYHTERRTEPLSSDGSTSGNYWVFTSNFGGNSVSSYALNGSTGVLTALPQLTAPEAPYGIAAR